MREGVQKSYLKTRMEAGHLPDRDGNLWKAAWGVDLSNTDGSRMGVSTETTQYVYDLKTNKETGLGAAKTEYHKLIRQLIPLASGSTSSKIYLNQRMVCNRFVPP